MAKKKVKARKSARRSSNIARAKPKHRIEVIYSKKEHGKAPVEKHFVLQDGRKLESLYELVDELETMSENVFKHYVNEARNDFSKWVRDVFESRPLADELEHVRDRLAAQRVIMRHLLSDVAALAKKHGHVHLPRTHHKKEEGQQHRKGAKLVIHEP